MRNSSLELLNLYGCEKITNNVLFELARYCPKMSSLNIGLCSSVTDTGVIALAHGCCKLQALNLAGIRNVSEIALCALAEHCSGLLMLNVTGCDKIAISGIRALVMGLKFVVEAVSFVGFKPLDAHIELKLMNQLQMIHTAAAVTIQKTVKAVKMKVQVKAQYAYDRRNHAAQVIQRSIRSYGRRLGFFHLWRARVKCQR
jgi:hypothetical protein